MLQSAKCLWKKLTNFTNNGRRIISTNFQVLSFGIFVSIVSLKSGKLIKFKPGTLFSPSFSNDGEKKNVKMIKFFCIKSTKITTLTKLKAF